MSIAATNWVWSLNDKALPNASTKLALLKHADHAHDDGTHTWQTIPTIAKFALCSTRTATRMNGWLLENGLIREGDQSVIPDKYKNGKSVPIAYELAMNETTRMQWEIDHAAGLSNPLYRAAQVAGAKGGKKSAENKAAAKAQVARGDKLAPQDVASTPTGISNGGGDKMAPHPGGDNEAPDGVTDETGRGDTGVTQTTQATTQANQEPSSSEPADAAPDPGESETKRKKLNENRPDVERLCQRLHDRIVANDCKPPTITEKWRDAARLMLDADKRSETQVANMIDWATSNEFWRANILSMPTLREKYDQMRLRALEEHEKAQQQAQRPGGRAPAYSDKQTWGDVTPQRDMSPEESARLFGLETPGAEPSTTQAG